MLKQIIDTLHIRFYQNKNNNIFQQIGMKICYIVVMKYYYNYQKIPRLTASTTNNKHDKNNIKIVHRSVTKSY